jgi:hypothetical protein
MLTSGATVPGGKPKVHFENGNAIRLSSRGEQRQIGNAAGRRASDIINSVPHWSWPPTSAWGNHGFCVMPQREDRRRIAASSAVLESYNSAFEASKLPQTDYAHLDLSSLLTAATSSSLATRKKALFILRAASAIPMLHIASHLMLGVNRAGTYGSKF